MRKLSGSPKSWYGMKRCLDAESSRRTGPPSIYADCFANEINSAIKTTEKNYSSYMFREALKTGFSDLQDARDEYRLAFKENNQDNVKITIMTWCGVLLMSRHVFWHLSVCIMQNLFGERF
jgi:hypothetical protein